MSESIVRDNYFLLYSLLLGMAVTNFYDILRILRRVIKHKDALVSIEDFVYWIIVAISVFYVMHTENNGTLRWFAILGAAAGMGIYKKLFGTHFVNIGSRGLGIMFKYIGKISGFILKPFRFIIKKKLTEWSKALKMVLCKQ